jgi:hypothetical protein
MKRKWLLSRLFCYQAGSTGDPLGRVDGSDVVGALEGRTLGLDVDGASLGAIEGRALGLDTDGASDGKALGRAFDGISEGSNDGNALGFGALGS